MKKITKISINSLTKQEFNDAYEEMLEIHKNNMEFRPLPTKQEILQQALQIGQISPNKYMEFNN